MNFSHPMTCVEKFRFWIIACQPDPIANWKAGLTGLLYLYYYNTNVKRIKDNWGTYMYKELNKKAEREIKEMSKQRLHTGIA